MANAESHALVGRRLRLSIIAKQILNPDSCSTPGVCLIIPAAVAIKTSFRATKPKVLLP